MVDARHRAKAAELIQGLIEGRITNDEFDEQYPHRSSDAALENISCFLWLFWDERESHTLEGERRLSTAQQALCERCYVPPNRFGICRSSNPHRLVRRARTCLAENLSGRQLPDCNNVSSPWWPFANEERSSAHLMSVSPEDPEMKEAGRMVEVAPRSVLVLLEH
jgi:hypothetical protein